MAGSGVPFAYAIAITLAFGLAVGAVGNGFLIGKMGLPFLVVTLGTLTLYGGWWTCGPRASPRSCSRRP